LGKKLSLVSSSFFAHSVEGKPSDSWQKLEDHLLNVANLARSFAEEFGAGEWRYLAGLWHPTEDINAIGNHLFIFITEKMNAARIAHPRITISSLAQSSIGPRARKNKVLTLNDIAKTHIFYRQSRAPAPAILMTNAEY